MAIQISVVVCTFNRANYLRKAIQSLIKQSLETNSYEILVVDNRSTDETKQVITQEFSHIPNLRYLYGTHSRTVPSPQYRLDKMSLGNYVAYLDDDAIASFRWLENIIKVFETVTPKPGAVGGKVEPIWEFSKPSWLNDRFLPYLTIIDWSAVPTRLDDTNYYIAGANMAFPKSVLELVQGFPVKLGRQGKKLLSNEDAFLAKKIKQSDYSIYYVPELLVKHHIVKSRLNKQWFFQRIYWQGVSDAFFLSHETSHSYVERCQLAIAELKQLLKRLKNIKRAKRFKSMKSFLLSTNVFFLRR
ncbi:MAG: glycosyltransferase [Hydrococcus sp. CSU_1_8]|nr:glycosyltransferase [Hydrococcus sp. CSU_1_8]